MNAFGRLFRVSIFGESHGESVGVVIDGCPAGLALVQQDFLEDLERRKGGVQKGTTPRKEEDLPIFKSGIFNDKTTGAPITILFENKNTRSGDYEKQRAVPRPGHADFVAHQKFGGFEDFRGGGHFSGRLTVGLVAAGVIAKKLLKHVIHANQNIEVNAAILEIAGEKDLDKGLQIAIDAKDSVGGIVECRIIGLPAGLGEPFFDSVEAVLAHAVFSIPAVRGVEFGTGFAAAKMFGSQHNDAIADASGKTVTNHAGGVVGGISNGNDLIFRIAIKPTSSTPLEQHT
jgi:chorismate synthase